VAEDEPFDLVEQHDLDDKLQVDLALHGWADVAAMLRPSLIQLMLERGATPAVYLDADVTILEASTRSSLPHGSMELC